MKRLSIIVPVFNVEPYLHKCVASLLDQDIDKKDYEIILIDDGSTDRCGQICDEFASHNDNIRAIHQPNGGLSAARNTGIAVAQGKYIQFVDSDDYLEPAVLDSLLLRLEEENLDVLRFNYQLVDTSGKVKHPYKEEKTGIDFHTDSTEGSVFLNERLGFSCYAWQFILKTDLIRNNNILFTPKILFEDVVWSPEMIITASKVSSTESIVYNYLIRDDSITKNKSKQHLIKVLDSHLFIIKWLKSRGEATGMDWFYRMIALSCITYLNTVALNMYDERKNLIKRLSELNVLPSPCRLETKSGRRKLGLINISPALFCFILHSLHT